MMRGMKTKEELISEYNRLYKDAKDSNDKYKWNVFGSVWEWTFGYIAGRYPDIADSMLSHLQATQWNNYLSEKEMLNISRRMVNQDGSKGFHWSYETFMQTLESLKAQPFEKPYYNPFSLCAVANMIYSDHAESIAMDLGYTYAKEVPNGKMALSCYRKAIEKLKDSDNVHFVRIYFKDKMYDDSPM